MAMIDLCAPYRKPAREFEGEIRAYRRNDDGTDTCYIIYTPDGSLSKVTIERSAPSGKYFGYTVSHKITAEFLWEQDFSEAHHITFRIREKSQSQNDYVNYPDFFIEDVLYDKVANKTIVTGYDIIAQLDKFTVNDVEFEYPITLQQFGEKAAAVAGAKSITWPSTGIYTIDLHKVSFSEEEGLINVSGTETLRAIFEDIAEFVGGYVISSIGSSINVKQFSGAWNENSNLKISKSDYFEFTADETYRALKKVATTNALGDIIYSGEDGGGVQTLHENCFLELRDNDKASILDIILAAGKKATGIRGFTMKTRGFPPMKFGYLYTIPWYVNEDGNQVFHGYIPLNETIVYDGGLSATISSDMSNVATNIHGAPSSIGEAIKNTIARIDRVNNEIELVSEMRDELKAEMAELRVSNDEIKAEVETTQQTIVSTEQNLQDIIASGNKQLQGEIDAIDGTIVTLTERVSTSMTSKDVEILIQRELSSNDTSINSVTTTTGFTFDADGLTIDKSSSEMSTQITEDGMTIYRNNQEMLVADHIGVKATNLHATTFLLIGTYSRLEDYQNNRTGCFWMGSGVDE